MASTARKPRTVNMARTASTAKKPGTGMGTGTGTAQKPPATNTAKRLAKKRKKKREPGRSSSTPLTASRRPAFLTPGKAGVAGYPLNVFDETKISALSFLIGAEARLAERFTVGARIPLVLGSLESEAGVAPDESRFAPGNVELEGAYLITKGDHWSMTGTLELALPTAGGTEPPSANEVASDKTKEYEYKKYQTFAAVKAASATRGGYESALFEPGNFGIIPKISAKFGFDKWTIQPTVKLENLISVTKEAEEQYINELVGGLRVSYRVHKHVEPGVHVWGAMIHEKTKANDEVSGNGVVEPYVAVPVHPLRFTVGAILPFAGELADEKTIGFRLSAGAEF